MPFSVPGSHPGYHITFTHQISLGSSWPVTASQTMLAIDDIDNLQSTGRYFVDDPSPGIGVKFFS